MRIVTVEHGDRTATGIASDHSFLDLSRWYGDAVELLVATHDTEGNRRVQDLTTAVSPIPLTKVRLLCPIPDVRRVLCVGTNYAEHVSESDRVASATEKPMLFTRFASSFVDPGASVVRPAISDHFDYEGEMAVVIARPGFRLDRSEARSVIGGYSCFLDGTLRDYQRHTSQFTPGKTADKTGSWGPWIVTADEVPDPYDLRLTTSINGETMQDAVTKQLIFDLEAIVSYCSQFMTLQPGDVIATGTPGGVGYARNPPRWLAPGDRIEVTVSGVGTLSNGVVDE